MAGKRLLLTALGAVATFLIWDRFGHDDPSERILLRPDFSETFLLWVQSHPAMGIGALLVVIAGGVVSMVPIGTPLTMGCGYIYKGVYGWRVGLIVASLVSMVGSAIGALICFLLGRYLMREQVRKWVRKYPLFDAIDVAASENGFRIMAMLYLTPVLPLGLVSYMCGTTSMSVMSFTLAKVVSLPLYLMYTFFGASAHAFLPGPDSDSKDVGASATDQAKDVEENEVMILAGIVLSAVMMTLVTRHIRQELMKILERQKKSIEGDGEISKEFSESGDDSEALLEMGLTKRRQTASAEQDADT